MENTTNTVLPFISLPTENSDMTEKNSGASSIFSNISPSDSSSSPSSSSESSVCSSLSLHDDKIEELRRFLHAILPSPYDSDVEDDFDEDIRIIRTILQQTLRPPLHDFEIQSPADPALRPGPQPVPMPWYVHGKRTVRYYDEVSEATSKREANQEVFEEVEEVVEEVDYDDDEDHDYDRDEYDDEYDTEEMPRKVKKSSGGVKSRAYGKKAAIASGAGSGGYKLDLRSLWVDGLKDLASRVVDEEMKDGDASTILRRMMDKI